MQQIRGVNVLFIAGFGPIVHEASTSRQLYRQIRDDAAFFQKTPHSGLHRNEKPAELAN